MDVGFAQVLGAVLGAIGSIGVAVIGGYFALKVAKVSAGDRDTAQIQPQPAKPVISGGELLGYALVVGIVSIPVGFALAYVGNLFNGVPSELLFNDSLDPALVSGILGFVGFIFGAWIGNMSFGMGRLLLLFLIVSVVSGPVGYLLAYVGNWLGGVPKDKLFVDSLDSLIVGGIICSVSLVLGVFVVSRLKRSAAS